MNPCAILRELWASFADWRQCGDLAGHLRAWWGAIHTNPDRPIPYTVAEV
jgi:hypothetical protein